jgi:tagatose-1,6-bisphosphate aldolase
MNILARYKDGSEVNEGVFKVLSGYSPDGVMDVFASDQHSSYLKLTNAFFKHIGEKNKEANDEDVKQVCRRFAKHLKGSVTAALFNHLAFLSPGFKELLGSDVLLIGRLEDTKPIVTSDGRGKIAKLAVQPEEVADKVDGFKTLVYLNTNHKESWEKNKEWLIDVFERCKKLGKPLYNETLLLEEPGESKIDKAKRLPEALIKMAEEFSPYGNFYKTQVPVLWTEDEGKVVKISSPDVIRDTAIEMEKLSPRPLLLLSAAVDFEQYSVQYGCVSDLVSGPMCGRAYFKESFTDQLTVDWDTLEKAFRKIAIPRIQQIRTLAKIMAKPWWYKFEWMSDEAKNMLTATRDIKQGVKGDFGY